MAVIRAPGLAGLLLFVLLVLAIPAAVIMFISVIMGLLDWLSARTKPEEHVGDSAIKSH